MTLTNGDGNGTLLVFVFVERGSGFVAAVWVITLCDHFDNDIMVQDKKMNQRQRSRQAV